MWGIYVWLWSNVPLAAFLVTGLTLLLVSGTIGCILEPRFNPREERVSLIDLPRPAPRVEPKPQVWVANKVPDQAPEPSVEVPEQPTRQQNPQVWF